MKKTKKMMEVEAKLGESLEGYLKREYKTRSTVEISKTLGIQNCTVGIWIKKFGIQIRSISDSRLLKKGVKLPTKNELYDLYYKQNLNKTDIGKKYNVSHNTIGNLMRRFGFKTRDFSEVQLIKFGGKKPTKEELMDLYIKRKLGTYEIGEFFGISNNVVRRLIKQYKIPKRNLSESQLARFGGKKPTKKELEELYNGKNLTSPKIAKIFGVSSPTINCWLKENGVKSRRKSIYDSKELRKELVDKILEFTEKNPEDIAPIDFYRKDIRDDSMSFRGLLKWYTKGKIKESEAVKYLVEDLYGVSREDNNQRLEKVIDGFLEEN